MPDEIIINDEIKSDEYSVSINSLVILHKPKNINALSKLLDNNGYFGRYKILRRLTKKIGDTIVNIEVYLPNSLCSYIWPFETVYNLKTNKLVKRIALKSIRRGIWNSMMITMTIDDGPAHKLELKTLQDLPRQMPNNYGLSIDQLHYLVRIMAQAGLFGIDKNNKLYFKLKYKQEDYNNNPTEPNKDFIEVIDNLLSPDQWPI